VLAISSVILTSNMRVEVCPLVRLPKDIHSFTYLVPPALAADLKIGQAVLVPFRQHQKKGVIIGLSPQSDPTESSTLKPITSLLTTTPIIRPEILSLFQQLAAIYGVSLSVFLKLSLGEIPVRKKIVIPKISLKKKKGFCEEYCQYHNEKERLTYLRSHSSLGQTLILVPEVNDLAPLQELLKEKKERLIIWHSELSTREKNLVRKIVREQKDIICLGTRSAIFLPFANLGALIIDREQDENHKHWDQNPRWHNQDVGRLLAQTLDIPLTFCGYSPSLNMYYRTAKSLIKGRTSLIPIKTTIIDLGRERLGGNFSPLGEAVIEKINNPEIGQMFFNVNRLGLATTYGCNDCGYIYQCPQCQLPLVFHEEKSTGPTLCCHYCHTQISPSLICPQCHSTGVKLSGIGTELLAKEIRRFLIDPKRPVIKLDSLSPENKKIPPQAIIVGTDLAWACLDWSKLDVIVIVDFDRQTALPEYRANENTLHKLARVQYKRHPDSEFFIQTSNPQQLLLRSCQELDRFYRLQLQSRRDLHYPPYEFLTRYIFTGSSVKIARERAQAGLEILTKSNKFTKVMGPLEMQPKYYRGEFWQVVIARTEMKKWAEILATVNPQLATGVKIDPNPLSLLSP